MKRLAALAQHITVLNLFLAALLLALGIFVIEPLLLGSISIPLSAQQKASDDKKKPAAAPQRIVVPLEEVLVIADQNLYYQDAVNKYLFGPMFGMDLAAAALKKADESANEQLAVEQSAVQPLQDYLVIADQNLFHPERRVPPLKKPDQEIPRPEFVLYGTLVSDDISIAYMGDKKAPRSTTGRGSRQTSVQVGGAMSGYTLKEVLHDRVVMVRGEDRIEVRVIAPGGKKERGGGAVPAAVTSVPATAPATPGASAKPSAMPSPAKPAMTPPVSPTGPNPTDTRSKPSQFRRSFTPSSVGTR